MPVAGRTNLHICSFSISRPTYKKEICKILPTKQNIYFKKGPRNKLSFGKSQ